MSLPDTKQGPDTSAGSDGQRYAISYRNIVWSVLLSLVVVVVVGVLTYEPEAFRLMWDSFHPWILALAAATIVARIVIGGWRLQYVSSGHISFSSAIRGQLAWDFFSIVGHRRRPARRALRGPGQTGQGR